MWKCFRAGDQKKKKTGGGAQRLASIFSSQLIVTASDISRTFN